jgi:glycosyltransferase involved in cell wall biosynthesis
MSIKRKFSIITVVLNNEQSIERTIKSVIKQTYKNYEYIIVDGNSTDKTHNIFRKYKKKITKLIIKKDKNLWQAMNRGIAASKGEIICIINSDDYFTKNALNIANTYFQKNNIDYFFGAVKKRKVFYHFNPEKINYKFNCYPSHSVSFFVKKKVHKDLGNYDEDLEYCADYSFFYKLFTNKKYKFKNGKKTELLGYFNPNGLSSKVGLLKKLYYESVVRLKNNQNFFLILVLFFLRILNELRNKLFFYR